MYSKSIYTKELKLLSKIFTFNWFKCAVETATVLVEEVTAKDIKEISQHANLQSCTFVKSSKGDLKHDYFKMLKC